MTGRALVLLAGLAGLAGVALSARAAHGSEGPQLAIAAQFLLFHAPALLALACARHIGLIPQRSGIIAGLAMGIGLALFSGDLAMRGFAARPLFPFSAPVGGALLMFGWLAIIISALIPARKGD